MIRRISFYAPCPLLYALLLGCYPQFVVPEMSADEIRQIPDYSQATPQEVSAAIHQARSQIKTIRGFITGFMKTEKRYGTFDGALAIQWPDALRLKAFRSGSITFMDLIIDKSGATLFLPGEGKVYRAWPDQTIHGGDHSLGLTPVDFLGTLTGASNGLTSRYDPQTLFVTQATNKSKQIHVRYLEYRLSHHIWFPRIIEVKGPGMVMKLLLKDPAFNDPLPLDTFQMTFPDDVEIIQQKE